MTGHHNTATESTIFLRSGFKYEIVPQKVELKTHLRTKIIINSFSNDYLLYPLFISFLYNLQITL